MKKETKKYLISLLAVILLTIITLILTFKDEKEKILELLNELSSLAALVIVLFSLAYIACAGVSIYLITKIKYPTYRLSQAMINGLIGQFFSGITPGASGGQVGQIYVFSKQKVSAGDGASILYLEFIMYQIVLIVYTLFLLIWKLSSYYYRYPFILTLILIGFAVNGAVLVALWTIVRYPLFYEKVSLRLVHIAFKIHLVKDEEIVLAKWHDTLSRFMIEIKKNSSNKKLLFQLILVNIIRLTIYFAIPYSIGQCLHLDMPFWDTLALSSFVCMANAFFPVPGATGGTELMFITLFSLLLSASEAKSVMLCWRFATFHLVLILGGICLIGFKMIYRKKEC